MRILLLRPGALGDLLLGVPAMATLRARLPVAHIVLAGHSEGVGLLQECGLVDEGISQDDGRLLGLFLERNETSDRANPPHGGSPLGEFDIAVGWLRDAEGIVATNFKRIGARRIIVAPSAPEEGTSMHVADHLLRTLSPLGIAPASHVQFRLRPSAAAEMWAREHLTTYFQGSGPVVALHPGSGSARKNWPAARFAAVVNKLLDQGIAVVLVCGPADESVINTVFSSLNKSVPIVRHLPLSRLAALLAKCAVYLGNDSGITHLAGLTGAPTIALFGPTDPAMWGPIGGNVTILRWETDQRELTPERVAQEVLRQMRQPSQLDW